MATLDEHTVLAGAMLRITVFGLGTHAMGESGFLSFAMRFYTEVANKRRSCPRRDFWDDSLGMLDK